MLLDDVFVDDIPVTAAGKLNKRTLREQFRNHQLPTASFWWLSR